MSHIWSLFEADIAVQKQENHVDSMGLPVFSVSKSQIPMHKSLVRDKQTSNGLGITFFQQWLTLWHSSIEACSIGNTTSCPVNRSSNVSPTLWWSKTWNPNYSIEVYNCEVPNILKSPRTNMNISKLLFRILILLMLLYFQSEHLFAFYKQKCAEYFGPPWRVFSFAKNMPGVRNILVGTLMCFLPL